LDSRRGGKKKKGGDLVRSFEFRGESSTERKSFYVMRRASKAFHWSPGSFRRQDQRKIESKKNGKENQSKGKNIQLRNMNEDKTMLKRRTSRKDPTQDTSCTNNVYVTKGKGNPTPQKRGSQEDTNEICDDSGY